MKTFNIRKVYRYLRNWIIYKYSLIISKEIIDYNKILIISPHPDDEALGCGGIISHQVSIKRNIYIIVLTKGENVHGTNNRDKEFIKQQRQKLTHNANKSIGVELDNIHFLDYSDGSISDNNKEETKKLFEMIESIKPDAIFIPHQYEGWNDHVKTNEIICKNFIQNKTIDIYSYCVWFWYAMPLKKLPSLDIKNCYYTKLKNKDLANKRKMLDIYFGPHLGIEYSGILPPSLMKSCQYKKEIYFKMI